MRKKMIFRLLTDTPFGKLLLEENENKLIGCHFLFPKDTKVENTATPFLLKVKQQLDEYFLGTRKTFEIELSPQGTPFQQSVWQALQKIPYGETASYKDIAQNINNPMAMRAVGMANNKNPMAIIIPCHRVIGSNGNLVGYAGGLELKKKLLELEQNNK